MIIKDNRGTIDYKTISDYKPGDVFEYNTNFFMKINGVFISSGENAINLATGSLYEFDGTTDQLKDVHTELIIHE